MTTIRIGAGAGFAGDRIEPAVDLATRGELDFLVFECLAERTIALAQLREQRGRETGYDPLLEERMRAVLPACRKNRTRIVSNMGAANVRAAATKTIEIARELALTGLRVSWIEGDDVLSQVDHLIPISSDPFPTGTTPISANAYLGAESIVQALDQGADVVLTGRVADPSLFLGPLMHSFRWPAEDWDLLGQGTAIGHVLECAGQLTGGYFADPGYKDVPGLDTLGFPLAVVDQTGSALLTKLEGTGGILNLQTCREQLLYEVFDPSSYLTPDVAADFSHLELSQVAADSVRMTGGRGAPCTSTYKVSLAFCNGFFGEGQISYGGLGAVKRARLARDVVRKRLENAGAEQLRFDLIGIDSLHGMADGEAPETYEVRLRAIGLFADHKSAQRVPREVESLYVNGPAGGGGVSTSMRECVAVYPALLPKQAVHPVVKMEVA